MLTSRIAVFVVLATTSFACAPPTARLAELEPIQLATQEPNFTLRIGQALEIAVFKALCGQTRLRFFGSYPDLDEHDDNELYTKEEPPSSLSGVKIRGERKLDFLVMDPVAGPAGLEVKNIREWLYPDRDEIKAMIGKCCDIDAIPVLIGRRIPYVIFSVLNPCGVIYHQTYNQLYANADKDLADKARDKRLLGYHDIRVGNEPDQRLIDFVQGNLPNLLGPARARFDEHKTVLREYGDGRIAYEELLARVRGY